MAGWKDKLDNLDNKEYEVQEILEARGPPENRFYFVNCMRKYPATENHWIPRSWCSFDKLIEAFWKSKLKVFLNSKLTPCQRPQTLSLARNMVIALDDCVYCCKCFKTSAGLKTHHTKGPEQDGGCKCKPASRSGIYRWMHPTPPLLKNY